MRSLRLIAACVALSPAVAAMPQQEQSSLPIFQEELPTPSSPFQPDLTPGYVLIEMDIQIPQYEYDAFLFGAGDAAFGTVNFWTAQVVPYDFVSTGSGAVSPANRASAVIAMDAIAAIAGIAFRPAVATDPDRIRFQSSAFNNSPVGRQGGTQVINIASWADQIIIVHEIYHSLGYWHEQSRPDRDTYITINFNSICGSNISSGCSTSQCCLCEDASGNCTPCSFNFAIRSGAGTYGPYDFDSFMHYGQYVFSCNGQPTITVNAPWYAQWQNAIGQRSHFSFWDALTCRGIYPCPTDYWWTEGGSGAGNLLNPIGGLLADRMRTLPANATLFIKENGTYSAVGTFSAPITIEAPLGATLAAR